MSIFNETNIDKLTDEVIKEHTQVKYGCPNDSFYWNDSVRCIELNDLNYWDWTDFFVVDLHKAAAKVNNQIRRTGKIKNPNILNWLSSLDLQNIKVRYKRCINEQTHNMLLFEGKEYIDMDVKNTERIYTIMQYMINTSPCYKYIKEIPEL